MGEGVSRFSVENFLPHSTEKLRRVTLLCSRKIVVPTIFRDKRGGEYHNFPMNFFCFTVPKNFLRERFSVSLISGIENVYASDGYVTISDFLSKFFCLTVPINFVGEPFCVPEKFLCRKLLGTREGANITISRRNFLSHRAEKIRRGTVLCFTTFGYRKNLDKRGREYRGFPSKIFCLTVPKNCVGARFCVPEKF